MDGNSCSGADWLEVFDLGVQRLSLLAQNDGGIAVNGSGSPQLATVVARMAPRLES